MLPIQSTGLFFVFLLVCSLQLGFTQIKGARFSNISASHAPMGCFNQRFCDIVFASPVMTAGKRVAKKNLEEGAAHGTTEKETKKAADRGRWAVSHTQTVEEPVSLTFTQIICCVGDCCLKT